MRTFIIFSVILGLPIGLLFGLIIKLKNKSGIKMANERIRVRLRGFDVDLVEQSSKAIVQTVVKAGAKVSGPIPLPTRINKYTVLRSPHVNKKSREQFEMRTHKRLIDILDPTQKVVEALMTLELPAGVDVEIRQ